MPTKELPYSSHELDGRRRLTDEQRQDIKELYNTGKSQRALARMFDVDKGTIKAIIDPTWYNEKQQKRYKQKPWLDYYQKEDRKNTMRQYRKKKRILKHTTAKKHLKPLQSKPIPEGYLTARQAGDKYHAHQDTIKKYVPQHLLPDCWNTPLFKVDELEKWNRTQRTKHQLSRIKIPERTGLPGVINPEMTELYRSSPITTIPL